MPTGTAPAAPDHFPGRPGRAFNGERSESFNLEGNHLVWQGPLDGNANAEIDVAYSATGKGVYTLEKPSGKILDLFRTKLIANRSNIRMLEPPAAQ